RLEIYTASHTDAGWRAGGDDISCPQGHDCREVRDLFTQRPNHVFRAVFLHDLPVYAQLHLDRLWIHDRPSRHDPRTERCERVVALPLKPIELEWIIVAHVEIPRRDVIDNRVSCDVIERPLGRDTSPGFANDRRKFNLPVELGGLWRHQDVFIWTDDRIAQLYEHV